MLELADLRKSFDGKPILKGVDLVVPRGEIFTLLGHSGCGKTTLLRIIAGLETADTGRVTNDGRVWASDGPGRPVPPQARNVGFVFQSYAIWPHMRVAAQVAYPLRSRRLGRDEIAGRVAEALELVGLDGLEDRYPAQLSGGQQQRVAMARAIVGEPSLLLLDEPFSNLDASLREQMRRELRELQRRLGLTVILVTHDQQDAFSLSDRIAVMNAGLVEQIASPEDLYDRPATEFVRGFIGRASSLRAAIAADGRLIAADGGAAAGPIWLRPEDLQIESAAPGSDSLTGSILSRQYLGDRYECEVRLADGQILLAYHRRGWAPPADGRVALRLLGHRNVNSPDRRMEASHDN